MLLALFLLAGDETGSLVTEAGSAVVRYGGLLGALLLLSVILNVWLLRTVIKVQNLRLDDRDKMADKMETLVTKHTEVIAEFKPTIQALAAAEKDGHETILSLKNSVDGAILEAIKRAGGSS